MAKSKTNLIINSAWIRAATFVIFLVATAVSIVVWANTAHSDLEVDIKAEIEKQYVRQKDHTKLEESLRSQKEDIAEIKQIIKEIYEILWDMHNETE